MLVKEILAYLDNANVEYNFIGQSDIEVSEVAGLDKAMKHQASFLNNSKYLSHLEQTKATLVSLPVDVEANHIDAVIKSKNPYYVYALIAQCLHPFNSLDIDISDTAVVDQSASLASGVRVDHNVVIKAKVSIGEGTEIQAGTVVADSVSIGKNCRIGSNVTIAHDCVIGDNVYIEAGAVIGGDGFGWANNSGTWVKIPQVGRVVIGNNVSIGNNVCIDRGAIGDTIIEDNCIIDNLVHIAHNCVIGSGSAVAGQTGFAGSTTLGKYCTIAGQAGFSGHISIADNSHFLAKAGVTHDIKEPGAYSGFPAVKASEWQKTSVRVRQLDKLSKKIKQLEKELAELKQ